MRILLDEDVPRRLKRELAEHDVSTVVEMGWSGIKNGVLLGLAAGSAFDVFISCDRNLQYQQNVQSLGLALVILAVPNKRMQTILQLAPDILSLLDQPLSPGSASIVGTWRV